MGSEIHRKLASIQRIEEVRDIEGADLIQAYRVLGWWVVDKRDAHKVDDLVVYISIDSWVPHELAPFLSNGKEPREYNGVKGERLRTIKLRGQVSQGLLLPMSNAFDWDEEKQKWEYRDHPEMTSETGEAIEYEDRIEIPMSFTRVFADEGDDLTELFGIQKWEAPIPAQLQGQAKGTFPTSLIPKTDQERIQNCFGKIQQRDGLFLTEKFWNEELQEVQERDVVLPEDFKKPTYEVTMKLDGSSMTIFRWENELRVCSRNMELKINEENADNTFVKMALEIGDKIPEGFAFQGELMGEGIQGNREGFKGHEYFVFDIFDIQKHEYLYPRHRHMMCSEVGLQHVPVLGMDWNAPESVADGLDIAEGGSINHKVREGVVYKCNEDPSFSFKCISNKFLLKGGN
jgi:RNA ligase (TIGR02306 family)